ncbi:hypothetical protein SPSPH_045650 [Sporomusa sphaeroides DSM 2875]|uniref:DUF669 domain-containing protein n=2 Tax=Sporomusa TaxID=2375 RepID=A0ABM9W0K7_9FIRM|nr:hypothetical protein SPSPH_27910 [Sporomusa sphaeroides DSM 2875]CVK18493.1 hypothetical protein SSPH_01131 [Sporomusa sphaeroides DSM 2875]
MSFKDIWDEAAGQEVKQFADDLPDGKYQAEVIKCEFGKTKDQTKDKVHWELKVIDGEQKGSHIWIDRAFYKNDNSEDNKKAVRRATDDFKYLGFTPTSANLENIMKGLVGQTVEIELKSGNNGQFKNLRRIVEKPVAQTQAATNQSAFGNDKFPEEEMPF